jgi:hypothetical protein
MAVSKKRQILKSTRDLFSSTDPEKLRKSLYDRRAQLLAEREDLT